MTCIQFSLRYVLSPTAVVTVLLVIGWTVGWTVALAALVATVMACAGVWCLRRRHVVFGSVILSVLGLAAFWMLFVDFSFFHETCRVCGMDRDIVQYRVLWIPVRERSRCYSSTFSRIAEDLGHPCPHRLERWHLDRYWGLLYRRWPSFNGTLRLWEGDEGVDGVMFWYDDRAAAIVRAAGKASPELGDEFVRRGLLSRDRFWKRRFMAALWERRRAEPDPAPDLVSTLDSTPMDSALAAATTLKASDLIVAPDPTRRPFFEGRLFDDPTELRFTCAQCNQPVATSLYDFMLAFYDWPLRVPRQDARRIAEILGLPRRQAWYGEDWGAHAGGDAVVGTHDCPTCGRRYLVYLGYAYMSPERFSVSLQGLARLSGNERPVKP